MKKRLLLILLLIPLFLSACRPDPNEEFIQGTWSIVNEAKTGSASSATRYFAWEFSGGTFYREEELDPLTTIQSQGRYRIVESDGDVLLLELYDIKGERFTYNNSDVEVKIEIDREQDMVRITSRLFERVSP
jgi:hypothetical protein